MPSLSRPRYARLIAFAIAAVLVFAQFALVRHQAEVQKHVGDHCEWCLTHAHLTDASPAAAWPMFADASAVFVAIVFIVSLFPAPRAPYPVRGPPVSASIG